MARVNEDPQNAGLPQEERVAIKVSVILNTLGILASPDLVRGCAPPQDSFDFLNTLLTMAEAMHNSAKDGNQNRLDSLAGEAAVMEFACANMTSLSSDVVQLLPSDISKSIAKHSAASQEVLGRCTEWSSTMSANIQQLQQEVATLSEQVHMSDDESWSSTLQEVVQQLQGYLGAAGEFSAVYHKELRVWCEALAPPQTYGFGAEATAMQDACARFSRILSSVQAIQRMQAAVYQSAPPLRGFQPELLAHVVEQAQREAARLQGQVQELSRARARGAQGPTAPTAHGQEHALRPTMGAAASLALTAA
eukprot:CAMPEP_0202911846 /NCGR_PEP_ID=MMETSP1392-20130828/56065_1 /ASSEMBLY_ACC=CAM_ASM_000868 /TAXON_ID=225041 /ORGANISM="Chlamydomonas chlamydogama, Strain SAG 11-48b" /LENGTH=306 /DNA_ID=CAMNT_0049602513 /DNA_START=129 /DNA_END=1049 /DNA_ORIENTATION=+